jgi:hypothetical protein
MTVIVFDLGNRSPVNLNAEPGKLPGQRVLR